ncbi:hypothetical protein [Cryobacterium algoricola]|nr:hypothetical protein [Cryobacterium algoricola]
MQSLIYGVASSGFLTDKSSGSFNAYYEQFTNGAPAETERRPR